VSDVRLGPLPPLVAAALLCSAVVAAAPTHRGATHTITIENMAYSPASLVVHRGDRIVWVNKDLFPHTSSATNGSFDSGSIDAGASWSYTAAQAGDFPYGCKFHPTMKGELKVE
jgi:plastocyanin